MNDDENLDKAIYLPRLPPGSYQGKAFVHWTQTIHDRRGGWLTPAFHSAFRELMLHTQARGSLICPVYCLMPDHIHLIWMGCTPLSDQIKSMAFLRTYLEPLLAPAQFQPQAHDHVLRPEESEIDAFRNACGYILQNPVRQGLVKRPDQWPYTGCIIQGYPKLHPADQDFHGKLWRIYSKLCISA